MWIQDINDDYINVDYIIGVSIFNVEKSESFLVAAMVDMTDLSRPAHLFEGDHSECVEYRNSLMKSIYIDNIK